MAPAIRSFAAIADAHELVAKPELLAAFARVFGPEADATLVLTGTELEFLPDAFAAAAASVGLDDATLPDVLALPAGPLEDVPAELAAHVDVVLGDAAPAGPLADLPVFTAGDEDALRRLGDLRAAQQQLRSRVPERLGLPEGYRGNDVPVYFDDTGRSEADIVHQPHVYEAAAAIARRTGATHIIDIGCGAADKLLALAPEFELVGTDFGVNLEHCREQHPEHTWLDWDLERDPPPVFTPELLSRSVIVCADVIEHLVDPTGLLCGLRSLAEHAQAVLLSTPDRVRIRGAHDLGPSPNLAHVREWTLAELTELLEAAGLAPAFAGHTLNNNRYRLKRTSLAIVDRRRARPAAAPEDFRVDEDWLVQLDPGKALRSPWPGISLRDALFAVQSSGYDAVEAVAVEHDESMFGFVPVDAKPVAVRVGGDPSRVFPYRFLVCRHASGVAASAAELRCWDADFEDDFLVERLTGVGTGLEVQARPRAVRALARPRVVMTLLVRDEIDVIRENLEYHLSHGVDFVIATDHLSTDGTTEVLEEYEAAGRLRLIRETAPSYDQEHWVTGMARLAATEHGADWVLNVDADEFWWTDGQDIAGALGRLPGRVDRVISWRYNFLPRPEDGSDFLDRMRWRATRSVTWDGNPMGPKVCHRASPEVLVPMGNHDAHGLPGAYTEESPFRVLHFPWRTREQVVAKVGNGTHAIEQRPELGDDVVSHWRALAERQRVDGADGVWQQMCVDDAALAQMLADGSAVEDTRLRSALRAPR